MAVRRESVRLVLEDAGFSTGMAKNAAATALLGRELDSLSGSAVRSRQTLDPTSRSVDNVGTSSRRAGSEIDRMSGRMRVLADIAMILGPSLVPIGAVAIPALTGLAAQFGAAAVGAGTALVAFQGVGDALKAVNDAALEPTTENLEEARIALAGLAPEAREFVQQLQEMRPAFLALRDAAASGLFPGLSEALDTAEAGFNRVERVLYAVGDAAGAVAAEFAEGLVGPRGQEFLSFIETEVPRALIELGRTVGNFASGMGELWMAFTPLNRDFSGWLLDASRSFDQWADGLSRTQGFQDFVGYIRENGPLVAEAMSSIGSAVLELVQAAAPLGGPVLQGIAAFADLVAAIASSPFGPALVTAATGLALVNRAIQTMKALQAASLFSNITTAANGSNTALRNLARAGAGLVAFAVAQQALEGFNRAIRETLPGTEELTGRLLDLNAGDFSALGSEFDSLGDSVDRITQSLIGEKIGDSVLGLVGLEGRNLGNAKQEIDALDEALSNLVTTAGAGAAEDAFAKIAEAQGLTADQTARLRSLLPGYTDALAGAENQARLTGEAGAEAGNEAAGGFRRARTAAEQFRAAVERANRILEGRASMRDYEAAIDDLSKSVRQNGRTLDTNTAKGRANEAALDNIAQTTLRVAENMQGTNRVQFLRQARSDFVDAANKLGIGRAAARRLWEQLTQLDKVRASPVVEVDTARAESNVRDLLNAMAQLRSKTLTVTTVFTQSGRRFKEFGPSGSADGSTVPKTGLGYADRHPYLLADGEEVISNRYGQADKHRELLKAINANRLADGGTAGRSRVSAATSRSLAVSFDNATVDIRTPWGTQSVELVARQAARSEVDAARRHDRIMEGR